MKLLLRRDQKTGIAGIGKVTFVLAVRADLSEKELSDIRKYKLGETMLYERDIMLDRGKGILGFIWRIFFRLRNITISVDDLTSGKTIKCKDIVEMVNTEEYVKEACETFKAVLTAAAQFGGEEIIEL